MPIVVRRGRITAEPRSRLLRFERPTFAAAAAAPVGIEPPVPDPRHELARLALDVVVRTSEPVELPRRWRGVPFAREVDRTRAQLAPIRSRQGLIASFSREASIAVTRGECAGRAEHAGPRGEPGRSIDPVQPPGPVRVAYAIRWLELGDGRRRPSWESFVAGPVELVTGALAAHDDVRNGEISR
jgi:hypothetical protein